MYGYVFFSMIIYINEINISFKFFLKEIYWWYKYFGVL